MWQELEGAVESARARVFALITRGVCSAGSARAVRARGSSARSAEVESLPKVPRSAPLRLPPPPSLRRRRRRRRLAALV